MTLDADALLARLPAFHRIRDEEQGGALRALLAAIAGQGAVLETDIARLYDGWFIETCDEWIVPYIGDLLGVRGLHGIDSASGFSQRALVANTLRMRRRKGTVPALEQVAFDSTGWRAHAVEFFKLLQTTQHVNHVRPASLRTPDLRDVAALERLGGPFETACHTAEVRNLPAGRYDIQNVGLYLWRLQPYRVQRALAVPHGTVDGLYHIDPLMRDVQVFNVPREEADITHLAEPINVPEPLSRLTVHLELEALRQSEADGDDPADGRFSTSGDDPVVQLWIDGAPVAPERLVCCDLRALTAVVPEDWRRPSATVTVASTDPSRAPTTFGAVAGKFMVGFDPVLGRIALPAGQTATRVEVASAYGFPGDIGAGPFDRRASTRALDATEGLLDPTAFNTVLKVPGDFATMTLALAAVVSGRSTLIQWNADDVEVVAPALNLPDTSLAIEAVNRRRPVLIGDFGFRGNAASRLSLSGITIDGQLKLQGALAAVDLRHCTLVPSAGGIAHTGSAPGLAIGLRRSLCGKLTTTQAIAGLDASDCVFDAAGAIALRVPDAMATLQHCTVFGRTQAGVLEAGNCLFTERVLIDRRQDGCVRFSYVTPDSQTPRRYRCQPDLVTQGLMPALAKAEATRVTPTFTSADFDDPAYAQLLRSCAPEIRRGADDGSEMGVWSFLKQPQREANLQLALDEYLRFGLEAEGLFVN